MDFIMLVVNAGVDFLRSTVSSSVNGFWVALIFPYVLYECVVVPFWGFLHIKN